MTDSKLKTVEEAAPLIGCTKSWLQRAATAYTVPHRRQGRFIKFTDDDINEIVAAMAVPAAPPAKNMRASRQRSA